MGQIEHVGRRSSPAAHAAGEVVPRAPGDVSFAGEPITYVSMRFSFEESWQMLSPGMRAWAEGRAGDAIRDPHTGMATVYWYCRVTPEGPAGPRAAAVPATYELLMFGKRGLVVSTGTTKAFQADAAGTAWRHRRFDVPVEPSGIRHDHRQARAEAAAAGRTGTAGSAGGPSAPLLPAGLASTFGNLPVATQRFLLEPFTVRGKRPVEADVYATTDEVVGRYRETYWCFLFDASWLAFAHAQRSVPLTSSRTGPALWHDSPGADALLLAPWAVAAWVAPVKKKERSVAEA